MSSYIAVALRKAIANTPMGTENIDKIRVVPICYLSTRSKVLGRIYVSSYKNIAILKYIDCVHIEMDIRLISVVKSIR